MRALFYDFKLEDHVPHTHLLRWATAAARPRAGSAGTETYQRSRRQRYKLDWRFGELKTRIKLGRLRLRRLRCASEQFLMATTAQNPKRLVKHLDRAEITGLPSDLPWQCRFDYHHVRLQ